MSLGQPVRPGWVEAVVSAEINHFRGAMRGESTSQHSAYA
jgi:hypothetical protein